jgi:hypothetical protein
MVCYIVAKMQKKSRKFAKMSRKFVNIFAGNERFYRKRAKISISSSVADPDPVPLVRCSDPDSDPYIIKQK